MRSVTNFEIYELIQREATNHRDAIAGLEVKVAAVADSSRREIASLRVDVESYANQSHEVQAALDKQTALLYQRIDGNGGLGIADRLERTAQRVSLLERFVDNERGALRLMVVGVPVLIGIVGIVLKIVMG